MTERFRSADRDSGESTQHSARVVALTAIFILGVHLTAWLGEGWIPQGQTNWSPELLERAPLLARFDAGHYRAIAMEGYTASIDHASNIAFFPLYPVLIGLLSRVIGVEPLWVGSALSHLCFIALMPLLVRHFRRGWGLAQGEAALWAVFAFPWSFFFLAVYSEALFLCLVLVALEAAAERRWIISAAAGFLFGLTRIGALAVVPAWLWRCWCWRRNKGKESEPGWPPAAALAPLLGVGAWLAWLTWLTGDPFAFVNVQRSGWARQAGNPLLTVAESVRTAARHFKAGELFRLGALLDLLVLILLVCALVLLLRQRRTFDALWVAGAIGLILVSGGLASIGRYALVVLPVFPVLASLHRPLIWRSWLLFSAVLQIYLIVRFVNHQWVA